MRESLYRIDASLATLDNHEVEALWRKTVASNDQVNRLMLARQLVLRALPVIEQTCRLCGRRVGLDGWACERAIEEASIKLMLRLLHDVRWSSLGAVAASMARTVIQQARPRGNGRVVVSRPQLRVVPPHKPGFGDGQPNDTASHQRRRPKEEDRES